MKDILYTKGSDMDNTDKIAHMLFDGNRNEAIEFIAIRGHNNDRLKCIDEWDDGEKTYAEMKILEYKRRMMSSRDFELYLKECRDGDNGISVADKYRYDNSLSKEYLKGVPFPDHNKGTSRGRKNKRVDEEWGSLVCTNAKDGGRSFSIFLLIMFVVCIAPAYYIASMFSDHIGAVFATDIFLAAAASFIFLLFTFRYNESMISVYENGLYIISVRNMKRYVGYEYITDIRNGFLTLYVELECGQIYKVRAVKNKEVIRTIALQHLNAAKVLKDK